MEAMKALTKLKLNNNHIYDKDEFDAMLGGMSSLSEVDFRNNPVSG